MPYFSRDQIETGLVYLTENGHQSLLSLLAMLRTGVPRTDDPAAAIKFGSQQENALLEAYFKPVGGTDDKPYYVPFGDAGGKSRWHDSSYAGSSLQRQRRDRSTIFAQPSDDNKRWYLKSDYVAEIVARNTATVGKSSISLPALSAWMLRQREVASLDAAVQTLIDELSSDRDGLIASDGVFTRDDLAGIGNLPFADHPIDDEELIDLLAAHSPPPRSKPDVVEEASGSAIPSVLHPSAPPGAWEVEPERLTELGGLKGVGEAAMRAISALRAGMHVIFTGPPGTGKTTLAEAVCRVAGFPSWTVPATDQWTTFETIGGYFPTPDEDSGTGDRLDFLPGAVVDAIERQRCLIIDEINRADIDKAFGELFTLLTGNSVTLPYRRRSSEGFRRIRLQVSFGVVEDGIAAIPVPTWWRIIGAMNDADKASLKRLSLAFVRRFAFVPIDIPDHDTYSGVIADAFDRAGPDVATRLTELRTCVLSLFADRDAGLGGIGLPMGPGIPLAMIRHGIAEAEMAPERGGDEILRSCLELYLVPQFQGRPDKHADILTLLLPYTSEGDGFDRLLGVWTGVSV